MTIRLTSTSYTLPLDFTGRVSEEGNAIGSVRPLSSNLACSQVTFDLDV